MTTTQPIEFAWIEVKKFQDIKYHKMDGIAKITINRPQVRNAFRPLTVDEMIEALRDARLDDKIGVIILCGEGKEAFCSGGDQRIRGDAGYTDDYGVDRLNILEFQRQIRTCPKPVIAMVAGYAIGGGHVLHVVCDLTICDDNAIFGQVGPKVGSFDGGFGLFGGEDGVLVDLHDDIAFDEAFLSGLSVPLPCASCCLRTCSSSSSSMPRSSIVIKRLSRRSGETPCSGSERFIYS